jgi:hypothetical protein
MKLVGLECYPEVGQLVCHICLDHLSSRDVGIACGTIALLDFGDGCRCR